MKPPTGDQYHRHLQAGSSTPVETPPVEVVHYADDLATVRTACGLTWSKSSRFSWTDGEDGTEATCPECWVKAAVAPGAVEAPRPNGAKCSDCEWHGEMGMLLRAKGGITHCPACHSTAILEHVIPVAAAPAPGVGDGPREMTPGEAWKADPDDVEVQLDSGDWCPFGAASNWQASFLDRAKFRLKPASAPRVSRLAKIVSEGDGDAVLDVCERVVEATLEAVRAELAPFREEKPLDRARAAMLEPK